MSKKTNFIAFATVTLAALAASFLPPRPAQAAKNTFSWTGGGGRRTQQQLGQRCQLEPNRWSCWRHKYFSQLWGNHQPRLLRR